jgi:hypothetical protein
MVTAENNCPRVAGFVLCRGLSTVAEENNDDGCSFLSDPCLLHLGNIQYNKGSEAFQSPQYTEALPKECVGTGPWIFLDMYYFWMFISFSSSHK